MPAAFRVWPALVGADVAGCPVCERFDCPGEHPDQPWPLTYPFLPGGYDPMAGVETVSVGERVFDPDTGQLLYGSGDQVPRELAERLGLVEPKPAEDPVEEPAPKGATTKTKTRPKPKRETR